MSMRTSFVVACLAGAFGLAAASRAAEPPKKAAAAPPATAAAPAMPGKLADFWTFRPKAGHEAQFEAAIKSHLAWRKQAGEGWTWEAYQPTVGTDLTSNLFRSGQHFWADFDGQQAWVLWLAYQSPYKRPIWTVSNTLAEGHGELMLLDAAEGTVLDRVPW